MQGKAESALRSEPLAYVLVPALKQWVERVKPYVPRAGLWSARASLSKEGEP
jgi:hypothetical protein